MKKVLLSSAAAAVFTATGLGLAGTASAATPAPQSPTVSAAKHCGTGYQLKARYNVGIRKKPTMSKKGNPILGTFLANGRWVCEDKYDLHGGKYKYTGKCKHRPELSGYKNVWSHITYRQKKNSPTIKGWVPTDCVAWQWLGK
ncbi:hypothetical protein NE236_03520 [Actinoallomurus purpureus]|uniref:hypothetical protein n=1 Tax=Actinoallomurus purpureus TaxID=478114 RepID=UPI002092BD8F|nr:hypothetical protein [Actinoallomurus purpureus]MCO6004038.1 hypothetical protein [Actinoallomurus purpureus]